MSNPQEDAEIPAEALFSMNEISLITEVMLDDGQVTTREQFQTWLKLVKAIRFAYDDEVIELERRSRLDPNDPDAIPF